MSNSDSLTAKRAIAGSAFGRIKDLVRELEENEKKIGLDFNSAEIEFKMGADDIAWYVAYKTVAAAVIDPAPETRIKPKG